MPTSARRSPFKPISLAAGRRIIARNNRRFERATKAERRVMVAQDVVERLETQQFIARSCIYQNIDKADTLQDRSLQEVIVCGETSCQCCGVGALFLSHVAFCNQVTVNDVESMDGERPRVGAARYTHDDSKQSAGLSALFSRTQLSLIECAFERCNMTVDALTEYIEEAISFGQAHDNSLHRLLAICRNIIAHEGTFRP